MLIAAKSNECFKSVKPKNHMKTKLIFLAMPTSGSVIDGKITDRVLKILAEFHEDYPEYAFIAPMIQDYQLLPYLKAEADWETWGDNCRIMIRRCDEVWVLKLDGWYTSKGVSGEIEHAVENNVAVIYKNV